jgi:hypothetical protein
MFDLGLCLGLHRLPIILVRAGERFPYNLAVLRHIEYQDVAGGDLKGRLSSMIRDFLAATRGGRPES